METREFGFIAPAHWFGSRTLRSWLWMHINNLHKETIDSLRQISNKEGALPDERDVYSVARSVILNITYSEIISCLEGGDFKNFVEYAKDYWADIYGFKILQNANLPNNERLIFREAIYIFKDEHHILRHKLRQFYSTDGIAARFSVAKFRKLLSDRSKDMRESIDIAGYKGGIQQSEAVKKLESSISGILNDVENICRKMLEFANDLLVFCGLSRQIFKDKSSWWDIEKALHQACDSLIGMIERDQTPNTIAHLQNDIGMFARLCWLGDEEEMRSKNRLPGKLAVIFSKIRTRYRNPASHSASSLDQDLTISPKKLEMALDLEKDIEILLDIIKETICFPEMVRILLIEKRMDGIELKVTSTFKERAYRIIYTDEMIIETVARDALESLIYEEKDQDFWLFPASGSDIPLNPLLIPQHNFDEYKLKNVLLAALIPEYPITTDALETLPAE